MKKDFTVNPALKFDGKSTEDNIALQFVGKASTETKSQRLNLLIKKSTAEKLKKIAHMQQASVNEIINRLVDEYVAANADSLAQYEKTFK